MDNEASDASSPQQYWLIPERLPGSVLKVSSELLLSFRIIDGDSYVSPSLLHFSSLLWHNFSVLLRCLGRTLASHVRKLQVCFCSISFSYGVPEPLPAASFEAAWSHPQVSVWAIHS
uniref:Uncharacterized protein n=1 Tax=Brassica oleracea TaxID=3712 RepID=Q2A9H5_BRAOL|nr:hypothetical protein 27.t00045 [Brassica oleracea]